MAKKFHRTVAQLLFLRKRARTDIETLVSFLTTRVKQPDKDDCGKLRHCLMYLKGTLLPEQRMLGSSDVLDNGWVFQHELRRVPEPSISLVAHPVRIRSASLLGTRSCKDWERAISGSANQLEREFMF